MNYLEVAIILDNTLIARNALFILSDVWWIPYLSLFLIIQGSLKIDQ